MRERSIGIAIQFVQKAAGVDDGFIYVSAVALFLA
jgi:hypothetical protein